MSRVTRLANAENTGVEWDLRESGGDRCLLPLPYFLSPSFLFLTFGMA